MISKYKLIRNRRGSWIDILFIIAIMFAITLTFTIGWMMMSKVNTEFQAKLDSTEAKTLIQTNTDRYTGLFDGIFLFVFFGTWIATLIGALFIDTHPAFFFISIILLVIACVIGAALANGYADFAANTSISDYADDFTYIPFIMQHYVQIIIFMVCSISVALYAKAKLL